MRLFTTNLIKWLTVGKAIFVVGYNEWNILHLLEELINRHTVEILFCTVIMSRATLFGEMLPPTDLLWE